MNLFTFIVLVEFHNYEKNWRKKIELNKHVCIMHYTIYKKKIVIHYIIYHLSSLFI